MQAPVHEHEEGGGAEGEGDAPLSRENPGNPGIMRSKGRCLTTEPPSCLKDHFLKLISFAWPPQHAFIKI